MLANIQIYTYLCTMFVLFIVFIFSKSALCDPIRSNSKSNMIRCDQVWFKVYYFSFQIMNSVTRKRYTCAVCEAVYTSRQRLNFHKKNIHNGERRVYEFFACEETFTTTFSRTRHMNIVHRNMKSHSCDVCDAYFSTKWNLELDNRQHHGNVVLHCKTCEKQFRMAHHLRQHEQTCIMDKKDKHRCDSCGKTFGIKSSLNRHRRQIHDQNTVMCDVCGDSFTRKESLTRHINRKHKEWPWLHHYHHSITLLFMWLNILVRVLPVKVEIFDCC